MIKYIIIAIIFVNISFSDDILNYKIKYFGIYAADCTITIKDTSYYNQSSKKISFIVKTKPFFDLLFPVDNIYSVILDENNRILSFQKTTSQPEIINSLNTIVKNDRIFYDDSDFEILPDYYNIFSLLYIMMFESKIPNNCIIEREGRLYDALINFNKDKFMYTIDLKTKNYSNPMIEHTDIFTWALFMDGCKRKIFINPKSGLIEKCTFSKGLINISAHLYTK